MQDELNITSLCSGSDPFPQMQIEDAVLRAGNETDQYCVLTFQTPSEMQYLMLRFEDLSLGCTDHFVIFDGPHAIGKSRMDVSCQHNRTSVGTLFTQSNYVTFKYTTDTLRQTNSGFTLILTAFQDFRHLCKQFE
ncbi:uncharacterized protein LOC111259847 isoform X2 [Varroa jacobsoni]|uniref:uncharacterized protein LOC111259847 isoform X2 n=1 Tax=Varroa jacobsoni TaxID=62625 RepID=UPI000BF6C631|nr:uncharacterized protein LOC111259847 isoform X2 [Varroa jacobsoni]